MTPEQWNKLQCAFDELIELDEGARADRLAALREEVPELVPQLERMLAADAADDASVVAEFAAEVDSMARDGSEDVWIGKTLGHYRIDGRIARGGMSAVFLASRVDQQFEHQVAIKILGTHLQSADAFARFRTERQILASLKHPFIGQLLDGGTTDDGLPYLVMEYIDGEPIDRYCDGARLGLRQRLQLFKQVCDAVDHAHRNLTVHRDIKPSNILVTADGTPKLIDFGIAKPLQPENLAHTVAVTQVYARAMTPEFASPEQVRGEPITTATDIYSLGVLLYKLLSGRLPYEFAGMRPLDIEAAICDTQPTRPSTVIGTVDETDAHRISEQRATSLPALRKNLAGDLDNIVLKTLEKEPERRYSSLHALIDDIERYERHEPVLARPVSAGYRLSKFVRRHRGPVAATAGVVVLIAGLVSYYTWQLAAERDRARTEASTAQQVTSFVVTLFEAADPARNNPQDISPRMLLDTGRDRIEEELAESPSVRAALLGVMSSAYRAIGAHTESVELAETGLALQLEIAGNNPAKVALAQAHLAMALQTAGQHDRSRQLFEDALPILRSHADVEIRSLLTAMSEYGLLMDTLGELDEAEVMHREVLEMMDRRPDAPSRFRVSALLNLSNVMSSKSHVVEQIKLLEQVSALLEAGGNASDYNLAITSLNLGNALNKLERFEESIVQHDRAVELFDNVVGSHHENTAASRLARSNSLTALGRLEEAEQDIREATRRFENAYGPHHPRVGLSAHYLGTFLWHERGDLDAALESYGNALDIYGQSLKPDHVYVVYTVNAMGAIHSRQGDHEAALASFDRALELSASSLPADHQQVIYAYEEIGLVQKDRGDLNAAGDAFEKALSLARRDGSYDLNLRTLLKSYIEVSDELGDTDKSEQLRDQLQAISAGGTAD